MASPFLTSVLDGEWSASRPGRFPHGEIVSGTHSVGGWVSRRGGLELYAGNTVSVAQPAAYVLYRLLTLSKCNAQ
jgi:hypothetical protein